MDTLKTIDRLVRHARQESGPTINVRAGVLEQIRLGRSPVRILPFTLFAGLSAAAAVIVLFLAVQSWSYLTSPMMDLVAPLQEAALW